MAAAISIMIFFIFFFSFLYRFCLILFPPSGSPAVRYHPRTSGFMLKADAVSRGIIPIP
jgi:hypothetical protein